MNNVVNLRADTPRKSNTRIDLSAALVVLARDVSLMSQMPMATKAEMQQCIFLIGLTSLRARQFIGQIENSEVRARLLAHAERLDEMIETARVKAAAL